MPPPALPPKEKSTTEVRMSTTAQRNEEENDRATGHTTALRYDDSTTLGLTSSVDTCIPNAPTLSYVTSTNPENKKMVFCESDSLVDAPLPLILASEMRSAGDQQAPRSKSQNNP